jgi:hypothetical protein
MPLLNYTKRISADRMANEIISLLVKTGAVQIVTECGRTAGLWV